INTRPHDILDSFREFHLGVACPLEAGVMAHEEAALLQGVSDLLNEQGVATSLLLDETQQAWRDVTASKQRCYHGLGLSLSEEGQKDLRVVGFIRPAHHVARAV